MDPIVFKPSGTFDGAAAWDLRKQIEEVDPARPVVVDFSGVLQFFDFGVAVLAHGLAQQREAAKRVTLKGVRLHQQRLFHYFGVKATLDAGAHAPSWQPPR